MEKKTLKIKDIKVEKELYPRRGLDWTTTARYHNAMKAGAKFPPVVVGVLNGIAYLIDGAHRIQALKGLKIEKVEAELLRIKDRKQLYKEAVKRNSSHGKPFTTQEVTGIIMKLEALKVPKAEISQMVGIPIEKVVPFVAKRATLAYGEKNAFPLKKTLSPLAGTEQDEEVEEKQRTFAGISQLGLLRNLNSILENNWLEITDKNIVKELIKLRKLMDSLTIKLVDR